MRLALGLSMAIILTHVAVNLHKCKCGSHKRVRRVLGTPTFFPTTYGGFFSQSVEVSCGKCGRHIALRKETWNRLPSDVVALFV